MKSILAYASVLVCCTAAFGASTETVSNSVSTATAAATVESSSASVDAPASRAIHLTASAAGSKHYRKNHLEQMLDNTLINAVIVDIKEEDGWVYIPGVK